MAKRKTSGNNESSLLDNFSGTYKGTVGLTPKQRKERDAIMKKYGLKEVRPKVSK